MSFHVKQLDFEAIMIYLFLRENLGKIGTMRFSGEHYSFKTVLGCFVWYNKCEASFSVKNKVVPFENP